MLRNNGTIVVANVSSNTVSLIDEDDVTKKIDIAVGNHPHEVTVSLTGKVALVSNYGDLLGKQPGDTLTCIDIENAKIIQTVQLPIGSRPHGIVFLSDKKVLITAQGIQSLLTLEFSDDFHNCKIAEKRALPGDGAHMVVVTHDRKYAYVANMHSGSAIKINLQMNSTDESSMQEIILGGKAEGLALSHDEKLLFVTNRVHSHISVIDCQHFSLTKKISTHWGPTRVERCKDGKSMLVIDSIAGVGEIIDTDTLEITRCLKTTNTYSYKSGAYLGGLFGCLPVPVNARMNEDQTAYITHLFAGNIAHVDLSNGRILKTFEASKEPDGIDISALKFRSS